MDLCEGALAQLAAEAVFLFRIDMNYYAREVSHPRLDIKLVTAEELNALIIFGKLEPPVFQGPVLGV